MRPHPGRVSVEILQVELAVIGEDREAVVISRCVPHPPTLTGPPSRPISLFGVGWDLGELVARYDVPGAQVAVLADGEIRDEAAGVLSLRTQVEATTESVFKIGSITKIWTASRGSSPSLPRRSTSSRPAPSSPTPTAGT
ncbi:serine hydrolase [Nonomuraea sp. NPDC049421]|uniref:serine hydrolase n=1 Tax=Nonomuraea sp. NPDC049421 TaxID=3155275 RepID=UPI0034317A77